MGGSPQSVIRAAHLGFRLMLAIIGRSPSRFVPFSRLYLQALERFGHPTLPIGVHSPGHVATTDQQAREEFWPRYREVFTRYSKIRGFAIPTRESFYMRLVQEEHSMWVRQRPLPRKSRKIFLLLARVTSI
nr:hypothetical protein [Dictyobacter alpinus]